MRTPTQQIQNVKILDGQTKSAELNLYDMTLAAIGIPASSPLNGKTLSFIQVIDGLEYDVTKEDGTVFVVALASSKVTPVSRIIAESLSQFKVKVNTATTGDGDLILFGINV